MQTGKVIKIFHKITKEVLFEGCVKDLCGANLSGANLFCANLSDANLSDANLSYANLSGANLSGAGLICANLSYADLSGANLSGANLSYANLSGTNLSGAIGIELAIARTRILPDGDVIGWKKCKNNVIVKLRVPEQAKRYSAFSRKCRAEFVDVLEVLGSDKAYSMYDGGKTIYEVGKRVHCDNFCEDWMQECAGGIHFFITKEEAVAYS